MISLSPFEEYVPVPSRKSSKILMPPPPPYISPALETIYASPTGLTPPPPYSADPDALEPTIEENDIDYSRRS
jgi:hypothetical protein